MDFWRRHSATAAPTAATTTPPSPTASGRSTPCHVHQAPISHNYRLFFHQFTGYADLGDGHKSRCATAPAWEYRRGSIEASTGLHQSTGPSGRFGASANVAWLPSDGWRLAANFDSDSNDLP